MVRKVHSRATRGQVLTGKFEIGGTGSGSATGGVKTYIYEFEAAPTASAGTIAGSATIPATLPLSGNTASYYGLNIPVSMGKRALTGVPIFAGAVRVDGSAKFIDVAYAFGEPGAPEGELIDTQVTKIWINGELVEQKSLNEGWASSGTLNYVVYPGYQDQFPDARIEKWLGANQTPAFRGLIYIVFYDLPLHQFSPSFSIPFVRAEFVDIIENVVQVEEFGVTAATGTRAPVFSDQLILPDWEKQHFFMFDGQADGSVVVVAIDLTTNSEISRNTIATSDGTALLDLKIASSTTGAGVQEPSTGYIFTQRGNNNHRPVVVFDPYSGEVLGEFGDTSTATSDNLFGAAAQRFRAPVSRSDTMLDRIICASTAVREEVGFWRISSSGVPSLAYADGIELVMGDDSGTPLLGGSVKDITTGDKIRGTNKGFGTAIITRETALYRATVQAGMTGDGQIIDVDTNKTPLHLPVFNNSYGGTTSQAYVDIVETKDPTNGTVAATASALSTGVLDFNFDLVDFGDLSAASFDTRASAFWIRFESTREFRQFFLNTRSLDNLHTASHAGLVNFEIAVSDDGTSWTPVSDFNISNTNHGVMIGSNASLAIRTAWSLTKMMSGESFYAPSTPFSPLPNGIYVGFAVEQKNYTDGSVVGFNPWAGGRDGLAVNNGEIQYPDLLVPHVINLWNPPIGYTTEMTFLEPKSEDLIIFFREDSSGNDYATRIEINDDIRGVPTPADPAGLGATELWTVQLIENMDNWANMRHSWQHSDLTSQTLGFGDNNSNTMNIINLATGHQRQTEFGGDWKVFGAGSIESETLDMQDRQVWNGAASTMISQWADDNAPVGFSMAKIIPFQTEVTGYPLSDLLRWMSLRVGYTEAEIDTTSVTDTVIGAILLERIPFRDLMSNMGRVYDFEVFESEGKIKFKKALKGGSFAIDFTLTASDVASIEGGEGSDPNSPYGSVGRNPGTDIPTAAELKYLDINADYTVNSAFARRTRFPINTTGNLDVQPAVYAVPIVMTANEALLRATRLLYLAWGNNAAVEYRVPTEYLTMEPADVVSLPIDGTIYQIKNIETVINADHSVSVVGTTVSAEELDIADAEDPLQLPQTVGGPSASNLFYMEIPPLTGADAAALVNTGLTAYTAVVSKGQGSWVSGSLWYNSQQPAFIKAYTNGEEPQASGQALGRLDAGAQHMIKYGEVLTTLLVANDATFVSLTAAQIINGDNLCAYGRPGRWELIQVQVVDNVVGNVFELSNIVRGLYGTEIASRSHQNGDLFITMNRPPVRPDVFASYADLGGNVALKAVGSRQDEVNITPEINAMTGGFERMLPVTNLKATLVSTDIVLTWDRRTRLDSIWVDEVEEVPEESTSGTFELEILGSIDDTGFIKQVLDLTDPTYTYLNADILTDLGQLPTTMFIRVYHNSTEVGRNLPETKELDVL